MSSGDITLAFREACNQFKAGNRSPHWTHQSAHLEIGIYQNRVTVRVYNASDLIVCAWATACLLRAKDGIYAQTSPAQGINCFAFEPK